ncbi:MAG: YkgJ family cysteine cluster protein [Candidatus Micrarchaeota archaeon]|nr:YkgJ family cysteine cluster protein [Candidatus Micrarchaeota archaeon]
MKNYRHSKTKRDAQPADAARASLPSAGPLPRGQPGALSEPCASCGEKCCNRFAVPVTGFDLVRIVDRLGDEPWEFAELAHAAEIQAAPHALVFIFNAKGELEERLLTLQRRRNNYCVFSRHSQGCAIWGFHPMVCRSYPFAYKEGSKIGYTQNFVCPRPWEQKEWPANVRHILERQNLEMEEYNKIVREWNATRAKKEGSGNGLEAQKPFWKFLLEKSREKMKEWQKEGGPDVEELGSNGPKRGFVEPEWNLK